MLLHVAFCFHSTPGGSGQSSLPVHNPVESGSESGSGNATRSREYTLNLRRALLRSRALTNLAWFRYVVINSWNLALIGFVFVVFHNYRTC